MLLFWMYQLQHPEQYPPTEKNGPSVDIPLEPPLPSLPCLLLTSQESSAVFLDSGIGKGGGRRGEQKKTSNSKQNNKGNKE